MNRQTWYLLILSLILLVVVILFSFFLLIPKGKEYRTLRLEHKKNFQIYEMEKNRYDLAHERLKRLESQHHETIAAFDEPFNPEKFEKLYKKEFTDLYLTEITTFESNGSFKTYEVNATSKITSPQSFYTFIDGINKSNWIIGINFPIHFAREGDKIRSNFTMRVHNNETQHEKKK